ncbi:phosphoglycerate mutase [Weissella oryzae SG25]|uniref:Phosphoglycerate mutase n=1 Tax=Weissella oryzae (strain DSM 25784 / JCM 18191 / LMG 30913 / SG25) TaxID=1329250 RepID=A0A069CWW9_WEIOS|nr:phosphoglycerate mutase family protein [Weissella oryzae]GAK31862.1 phosphoglycerate mutase [Weissella oryzae SG25]
MAKLTLYLIRHGQTYFNIYNKLQGWSNSPLTKQGYNDANLAANKVANVAFAAAYSSDTTRAQETAAVILDKNQASTGLQVAQSTPFLREQFYGSFEGDNMDEVWAKVGAPAGLKNFKEIVDTFSINKAKDMMKVADPFHDAEDSSEYWQRVDQAFALIASNPKLQDGDNVLVISHGNTLLSLMERYGAGKFDLSVRPANGSVTRLAFDGKTISVLGYNE